MGRDGGRQSFGWHTAHQYTMDRKQFGRHWPQINWCKRKLADMQTEIALGLQIALRFGRMKDEASLL